MFAIFRGFIIYLYFGVYFAAQKVLTTTSKQKVWDGYLTNKNPVVWVKKALEKPQFIPKIVPMTTSKENVWDELLYKGQLQA